jgi:eukaryotic-like serine/threonine-protein kinase
VPGATPWRAPSMPDVSPGCAPFNSPVGQTSATTLPRAAQPVDPRALAPSRASSPPAALPRSDSTAASGSALLANAAASVPEGSFFVEPAAQSQRGHRGVQSPRGTYVLGREVGSGHFGSVYECLGPFDQRYALKVLRPSGRPFVQVRMEWLREVQRLLALRHPNVVYVHDAFESQGYFCVALEWCDHTLRDMLEQPLREELAIELSRQMLAAVQYLHDHDVVHDDLHPGNVLIQQADRPIVKISDFGIAHELRGATAVRPEVVHHAIMAPELLAAGYTSKQSDLYQLGLVLYWMITGAPPIQLDVPYPFLVQQIAEGMARRQAEALGTPFGNIVAKLLRRRDAYRYSSAREVWEDLRLLPAWQERNLFPIR